MSFSSRPIRAATAIVLAAAMAASSVPTVAFAEEPSAADKTTARELFLSGTELRAKKDHWGALEKFKAANALVPTPITALEVGKSYLDLGMLVEASEKFIEASKMPPKPKESDTAKAARAEADKQADAVAPRIPSIAVKVKGAEGAVVAVDDRALPPDLLGIQRKVNPGKHVVVVKLGTNEARETVVLKEGEKREVTLTLAGIDAGAGVGTMATPAVPPPAPPGPTSDAPSSRPIGTLTLVGFGVVGVGLVAGSITGLIAMSKKSSLSSSCPGGKCGPAYWSDVDSYHSMGTLSTVSFAVMGAGVVVGVVGMLTSSSTPKAEKKPTAARITPWIGAGSAGIAGVF